MRKNGLLLAMTIAGVLALAALSGCSREKIDWKSAEAADTVEAYDRFLGLHPDGALAVQARARVAQLNEDRDWKKATAADTADAYKQFLAQHDSGKWAEEARIRVENFSLDGTATGPAKPVAEAVPAAPVAETPALPAHGPKEAQLPPGAAKAAAVSPPAAAAAQHATAASAPVAPPAAAAPAAPKSASAGKAAPAAKAASAAKSPSAAKTAEPKHLASATSATPAAAKPSAPAATPAPSAYGIQLGAFHSQDAALKNWKQLQSKYDSDLHGLFAHAVPVKQTSGSLFRLQAPVGEESRARSICASLSKQSQPCVVVLPQP